MEIISSGFASNARRTNKTHSILWDNRQHWAEFHGLSLNYGITWWRRRLHDVYHLRKDVKDFVSMQGLRRKSSTFQINKSDNSNMRNCDGWWSRSLWILFRWSFSVENITGTETFTVIVNTIRLRDEVHIWWLAVKSRSFYLSKSFLTSVGQIAQNQIQFKDTGSFPVEDVVSWSTEQASISLMSINSVEDIFCQNLSFCYQYQRRTGVWKVGFVV